MINRPRLALVFSFFLSGFVSPSHSSLSRGGTPGVLTVSDDIRKLIRPMVSTNDNIRASSIQIER